MEIGGAFHEMMERHRVCPEHGELVDVPPDEVIPPPQSGPLPSVVALESHHHCRLSARLVPGVSGASPMLAPAGVAPSSPELALRNAPRVPAIALLRLAPKASPPTA